MYTQAIDIPQGGKDETPRGRRKIDAAIQLRLDAADESLADISPAERARLAGLLRKVCLAAEED